MLKCNAQNVSGESESNGDNESVKCKEYIIKITDKLKRIKNLHQPYEITLNRSTTVQKK